ncbi:MAG: thermonuclease family protein [Reyranella sp.]|uniref:thermonuclease family protein n=1 Tax=Reyranella sp. TaxID=1929291 RepID=UPI001AC79847|nr:thermonuclease family protein [Reyranella sp.]MBN9089158.1 thermonuclease family protein [Reyranella sp.]
MNRTWLAALSLFAFSFPALAQTVTDGDTIKLDGKTYRLLGIDALETHQARGDGWRGGEVATAYLRGLMRGRAITCTPKVKDRYGRTVAVCYSDGRDLGADMVSAGMAYAFVRYSRDYVEQEASALAAGLSVHGHRCGTPWEWRARRRGDE